MPLRTLVALWNKGNSVLKRHLLYFISRTTPFQNPATARTAGSCERIGATKAPVLSPAFFRPPVHFQKHGNPPTEVGPIVVGKPHVILPFDEKGQCRREVSRLFATLARQGPKAVVCGQRMPPRPRPPDTAAHRGKRGRNCWGLNDREKRLLCRRRRNSRI